MTDRIHRDPQGSPSVAVRTTDTNRRRFLMFGAGAAGAAAAAPVLAAPAALVEAPVVAAPQSQGYQETAHVRRYYATTRL
jgi:NCAIR mutase (PurE)-related protein